MKSNFRRWLNTFILWLCLVLGFTVWCPSISTAKPTTVRWAVANEPPTLDWNLATDNVSFQLLTNIMEGLCQYDDKLQPIPALAQSWTITNQGKTYTFHLRKDVTWSDGVPFTAKHIYDSWIRLLKPNTAAEYAYFLFDIVGAADFNSGKIKNSNDLGLRMIDDYTLEVRLRQPAVYFPAITTFMVTYPIRLDLIEKYGDAWTEPPNFVTLGPYRVTKWHHEYKLELSQFSNYYGSPKPSISKMEVFILNEGMTALSLFETQSLDLVELPPIAIPHFENHPFFRRQAKLRGYYYGFNTKTKPFDDVRVRRAFSMAINRNEFPKILRGGELPATSWVPPGMFGYNPDIGLNYQPQKARQLLEEAGFPNGVKFPKIVAGFNTDPLNRLVAENIQAQLKRELNIEIVLDNQEWKVYLKKLQHETPSLFRLGWGADYPDPDNFLNLFLSNSGNNHTGWGNSEYDSIIGTAAGIQDLTKRKQLYDRAQTILCEEDVPIMPLFVIATNYLVQPRIKSVKMSPLGFIYWKKVRL